MEESAEITSDAQSPASNPALIETDYSPNETLYINNLSEKVRVEELKRLLFHLFSAQGQVLDVVAHKNLRMKGQAFVVFRDITQATTAMKELQGFMFHGKPMRVAYARGKSDAIARLDGTYAEQKRRRGQEKEAINLEIKRLKTIEKKKKEDKPSSYPGKEAAPLLPNKILFLQNLPPETSEMMLTTLFRAYQGFKEIRMVPGKSDIAFVEYENETQAISAMDQLNNFKLTPTHSMRITFAKK